MDRLSRFSEEIGYTVSETADVIRTENVPCLLNGGTLGTCTIEKSYDPESGKPNEGIGEAVHAVKITLDQTADGRVYHANGELIGNYLKGDEATWSHISIRKGSQSNPEEDLSARELVYRYVKQIVGAVSAAGLGEIAFVTTVSPFNIPNTFEDRTGISTIQDRIRGQRIAIIGLGGTGAYILDLVSKTPVREIHLLDADNLEWHNFFRAPGVLTTAEKDSQEKNPLRKVHYYQTKYAVLRKHIRAHTIRVGSPSTFTEFLSAHPIDFAFVCIDQLSDSASPRQDAVYEALAGAHVPFIDSGVSITLENQAISGSVSTSAYEAGSLEWREAIPNASVQGILPAYRNVQLPEVNALAAALAVMEWRRKTQQYISKSSSFFHKFRLETPRIATVIGAQE